MTKIVWKIKLNTLFKGITKHLANFFTGNNLITLRGSFHHIEKGADFKKWTRVFKKNRQRSKCAGYNDIEIRSMRERVGLESIMSG